VLLNIQDKKPKLEHIFEVQKKLSWRNLESWAWGKYEDNYGIESDWRTWTELKLSWVCSRTFIGKTANNNNRTIQTEVAGFLHDREFACVTEDIARETIKISLSFPNLCIARKQATSQLFVQLLLLALPYNQSLLTTWCQLQSLEVIQSNSKLSVFPLWAQAQFSKLH